MTFLKALGRAAWTGLFAVLLTAATNAAWSGLFFANLRWRPDLPWGAAAMAAISLVLWILIGRGPRAGYRRAKAVPAGTFVLAVAAGGACIVALAGLWIVLVQLVAVPGNPANLANLPPATMIASLAIAALSGGVFEEAGFRGYFQGTLEQQMPAWAAILICAALMAPLHGATQGFVWPVLLFYLLADIALGASAALTDSILPGIVVHSAGLAAFFALIWPEDRTRPTIAAAGPDLWFWIHAAQAALFGVVGVLLFVRLARRKLWVR